MVVAQVTQRNEDLIACSVLLPVMSFSIVFTIQPLQETILTHLSQMEFPTVINWICPFFRFKGFWVVFFIVIPILIEQSISKQWRP